ncbi:hypothetical protein [Methylorubrum zatmanii]|uniref:DdrB-like domain-containing protein n=1 Tax=Methylorubrum zatmanii TaxID=29429 RepID=A0ABW1WLU5_9HYPH|nr:hypothetical protein [Methylorubrum zatmanii]MBD8906929.1 hypothetical protein [Methylorubrum zatmanii]
MADDPWAAFRVASPAGAPPAPLADEWAAFRTPATQEPSPVPAAQPSVAVDVAKALPTGAVKGAIGLAGLPGDVQEMSNSLIDRAMLGAAHLVMDATGLGYQAGTPEREEFDRLYLGIGSGGGLPTSKDVRRGVEKATGPLYEPKTVPGQYAQTVGEFAPGALVGPGGVARRVAETVIPAALSETAGQATKGTTAEPLARLAGGVSGNLGVATAAARADAPARAIVAATRGTTEADLAAAQALGETAQRVGVPFTGAEAIQGATGNATKMGDLQRAVEGSLDGGAILSHAYADRPAQMRNAVDEALAALGPQSTTPSTLGPRGSQAAQAVIDDTRQGINRATRVDYAAAGTHVLDPTDFEPLARDPAFRETLRQLRADPVLGPTYRDMADNLIAVIDAVTKGMRDRGFALGNRANPGFSSEAAGLYTGGAAEARAIARDPARGGSQAYDDALTAQAQARRQNLEPLEQGPLGQLAQAGDTAAATQAVLPARPLVGGEAELADAVTRLRARDPNLTNELIRQRLADQFDASATRLVGGEAQGGGARFAKDIAGTEQQARNLDAVLEAIGGPAVRQPIADVLDVFRATGTRKPQGSPTDFNQQIREAVGEMPLTAQALTALRTGGASLLTQAGDGAKRVWLGRNNRTLAEILAAPDSVGRIGTILKRGTATPFADAALRQALQSRSVDAR